MQTITKNKLKFNTSDFAPAFWQTLQANNWEPRTFRIFDYFVKPDKNIIDIGAWIGATCLYNNQLANHCYAIEPDPEAFRVLKENVDLNPDFNSKISLFNYAISNYNGQIKLYNNVFGDSMSSVLNPKKTDIYETVPCYTLSKFIEDNEITNVNFIKMDTEGAEVLVLPTIKDYLIDEKIVLHLSLHSTMFNDIKEDSEKIIMSLIQYDNIYDNNGKKIRLKDLLNRLYRGEQPDIVCTMR